MKTLRRRLPPLDSLLFFEAAARCGSFTKAAGELYVSQAAVSKRIQQLEDWMDRQLFLRSGRRLTLTEEGRQLQQATGMALDYMEGALSVLSGFEQEAVRLAARTSIAMFWLMPRLQSFYLEAESCPINLVTTDRQGDLLRAENDLVLFRGDGPPAGWQGRSLLPETLVPVASPALAARYGLSGERPLTELTGPERPTLLGYTRAAPDWQTWEGWVRQVGCSALLAWPQVTCRSYAQSIGEAIRGKGIALGSLTLIQTALQAGQLIPLGTHRLEQAGAFWLLHSTRKPLRANAERLFGYLCNEADRQCRP